MSRGFESVRKNCARWQRRYRRKGRRHPGRETRRRPMIAGEFSPEESQAPPGYRIEVLVKNKVTFTNGDALRLRWQILVPIEEALQ
jgi:hypothetical protein